MTVTIRPQAPDDAAGLFAQLSDPRVHLFLDSKPPQSMQDVAQRIAFLARGHSADGTDIWMNWTVFADDTIAGFVQATVYPDASADIAFVIGSAFWGTGTAEAATRLMMQELRTDHYVQRFVADCEIGNFRSHGLLTKLGFTETHRTKNDIFFVRT